MSEKIQNYHVFLELQQDGTLLVTENITYDFGEVASHGIIRNIPNVPYLQWISVEDEKGNPYFYESDSGFDEGHIKIGDPDITITGVHTYSLQYEVLGAFQDDIFYWNVIGTEWEVPIEQVQLDVSWEEGAQVKNMDCTTGQEGSQEICRLNQDGDALTLKLEDLSAHEGVSLKLEFEPGFFDPPPFWLLMWWNWGTAICIFLALSGLWGLLWYYKGREPSGRDLLVPQMEAPKDLLPAEVGVIFDQKIQARDYVALLLSLAEKKVVTIEAKKDKSIFTLSRGYLFTFKKNLLLKNKKDQLTPYEEKFLEGFFGDQEECNEEDIKNRFYKVLPHLKKQIYETLVEKGFFPRNPESMRNKFTDISVLLICLGTLLFFLFKNEWRIGLSVVLGGLELLCIAQFMSKWTKKGKETYEYLKGFQHFLKMTEKDRLEFFNSPESLTKNPSQVFYALLPYALALGVDEAWMDSFPKLNKVPSWLQADEKLSHDQIFNNLRSLKSHMMGNLTPRRSSNSSSASTFTGGGMGGGGGRSW